MNSKKGISKIAIVIIIFVVILLIAGGTILTIWLIDKNKPVTEVKLYEEYNEGQEISNDEFEEDEVLTPLAKGLTEYRNDELGVRFGYFDSMEIPVDEEADDGTYISTINSEEKSTVIQLRIGKIDVSQPGIDHIDKQKAALKQELIEAETYEIEVEENGKKVTKTIVPTEDEVSDIDISYTLFAGQLAVRFKYTENDMEAARVLTIKDEKVYSLTYKAEKDDYNYNDQEKIFQTFEFIDRIDDVKPDDLNTVVINGKEYSLPMKVSNIEGLPIDSKYSTGKIQPNYYTVVSLYELQNPKYSGYIYNARASVNEIGKGYITAISTDVDRGGNIKIYKGVEIGTTYAKVKELLGSPTKQYYSDDESTLTNIYQIQGVTIQLRFRNDDLSKPDETSKVVSILLRVPR